MADLDGVDTSDAKRWAVDPVTGEKEVVSGMTYQEWMAAKREKYGDYEVDTALKKIHNENADRNQWTRYRERIREETPKTFKEFQRVKYGEPAQYADMVGFYRYKGRVPEAAKADFELFKEVKATGVVGTVRIPPYPIDSSVLELKDDHALGHGCTLDDAKQYVNAAKCSIRRKRWDGFHTGYYALDGATYVHDETKKINTIFPKDQFDPMTQKVMAVFE